MNKFLLVVPVLFLLLFGCIGGNQQDNNNVDVPNETNVDVDNAPKETVLNEIPKIAFTSVPDSVKSSEGAYFQWSISGVQGTISSTEVYYGTESVSNVDEYTSPAETAYSESLSDTSGNHQLPGTFEALLDINEPGTYYARAHAFINGKHYWTDEVSFTVLNENGKITREFDVNVNDDGFEPSVISVNEGDHVVVRFHVGNVNSAGVRIVAPLAGGSSDRLFSGDLYLLEFDAEQPMDIQMFWVAGNIPKASAHVEVN